MISKKLKLYGWGFVVSIFLGSLSEKSALATRIEGQEDMTAARSGVGREWRLDLEELKDRQAPTHFLVSKSLRSSKTFPLIRAAMEEWGIEGEYLPYELPLLAGGGIDTSGLNDFMRTFIETPFLQTMCVSDPYKGQMQRYVSQLTQMAELTGAVNFFYKRDGVLIGDNKDGEAFLTGAIGEGIEFNDISMVFFGCGGVSSAVSIQLALEKRLGRAGLIDPEIERREALAEKLKALEVEVELFPAVGQRDFSTYTIFYNGSGLGKTNISEGATPVYPEDIFPQQGTAIDANYTPWETPFLKTFEEKRYRTLNGFSHMVASSALHLSLMRRGGKGEVSYRELRNFIDKHEDLRLKLIPTNK